MATKKFNTDKNLKFLGGLLGSVTYSNVNGSPYIRSKKDIGNPEKTVKNEQKGSADIFIENVANLSDDDKNKVTTELFNKNYKDFVDEIDAYKKELGVSWHKSYSENGATGLREAFLPITNDVKGSGKIDKAKERLEEMVEELTDYNDKIANCNNLVSSNGGIKDDGPVYPFIEKIRKENTKEIKREEEIKQPEEIKKEGNDMKSKSEENVSGAVNKSIEDIDKNVAENTNTNQLDKENDQPDVQTSDVPFPKKATTVPSNGAGFVNGEIKTPTENDEAGEGSRIIKMPHTQHIDDEEVQSSVGGYGFTSGANDQPETPTQPEVEDVETPAEVAANPNAAPTVNPNAVDADGQSEDLTDDQEDLNNNNDNTSHTGAVDQGHEEIVRPVNAGSNSGNNFVGGSNPTSIHTTGAGENQKTNEEEINENNENGSKARGFFSKVGRWIRRHPFVAAITVTAVAVVGGALLSAVPVFAGIANGISSLVIGGAAASAVVLTGGLVARGVSDNYKGFIAKYDIEKHQKKIRKGQRQAQRLMDRSAAAMGTNRTSVAAQSVNIKTQSVADQALANNYNAIMEGGRNSKQRAIEAYFEKKNVKAFDKKVKKDTTEFEKIEKKINKLYDLGDIKEAERLETYLDEEMSKQDQRVAFNEVMNNLKAARNKNRNAQSTGASTQYVKPTSDANAGVTTHTSGPSGAVKFRTVKPEVETTGYTATPSNIKADVQTENRTNIGRGNGLVSGVTQTAGEQQTINYTDKAIADYIKQKEETIARLNAEIKRSSERLTEERERTQLIKDALENTVAMSTEEKEKLTKELADSKAAEQEKQKLNSENNQLKAKLAAAEKENDRLHKGIEANKAVIKKSKPSLLARIAGLAKDVFAKHSEEKTARIFAKETGKARINEYETKVSELQKEVGAAEELLNESATQTKELLEQNATKDAKIANQEKEIADLNGLIGYADELLAAGKITEEAYEQLLDEACQKYPEAAKEQEQQEWKGQQGDFGRLKRIKGFRSGKNKATAKNGASFIPADSKKNETPEVKSNDNPSDKPTMGGGR